MNKEVLNQQKIDELSDEIGSENVPILLDIFLGEMNSYVDNLNADSSDGQLMYLKEISHALKSSAASFGADRLCDLAIQIDHKVKRGESLSHDGDVSMMLDTLKVTQKAYLSWSQ